ncbi:MAG: DNA methyltransferase [Actinomycetes bacterium]
MTVLSLAQRKTLESVVVSARRVVELACADRIAALGVAQDKAPAGMSDSDRELRVGLRARARQLGSVDVLVSEAGFEHWHRMLFARLLADNGLLVDDEAAQPVSMEELTEYAAELGESDVWEVAARFASASLPGIFKQGDPILGMRLPVEVRQRLEGLLDQLPVEITTAEDSLGWVYQYWQKHRKDEVNASEAKIGGADLAPVTQLFTEDYMVRFLLENSLGAWWATRNPGSPLITGWHFLRTNEDGLPAAGTFGEWPDRVAEVTVMDPCCGSGHFLVSAFDMLWRMRVEEEGLGAAAAQDAVLRDNLFGLELDPRCTQIGMFALAIEAWKAGGLRVLPVPNVACSGIPARAPLEEWTVLADGDARIESGLTRLHALFADADTLGSLIDPIQVAEDASLESAEWHEISPILMAALTQETKYHDDPAGAVLGEAAVGLARAADYLSRRYTLIATNVPYLGQWRQGPVLTGYLEGSSSRGREDLAFAMLRRYMGGARGAGLAFVCPSEWMFLGPYESLRHDLLQAVSIRLVCTLGNGAFSTPLRVNPCLLILEGMEPEGESTFAVLDTASQVTIAGKVELLQVGRLIELTQARQLTNPDSRISLLELGQGPNLGKYAETSTGYSAGDAVRFERVFWELGSLDSRWEYLQGTVAKSVPYGGRQKVVLWEQELGVMAELAMSVRHLNHAAQNWRRGKPLWSRRGIAVSLMGDLPVTLYLGDRFDKNCAAVVPLDERDIPALWAFAESGEMLAAVRSIDRSFKLATNTLLKVPFDIARWRSIATQRFPGGLPEPSTDDPTQWLFKGDVAKSHFPLQVAAARLLGFHWPDHEPDDVDRLADDDGIVCLPAVGGEQPAEHRLRDLLVAAHGGVWSPGQLDTFLVEAGGRPGDLEGWLRRVFFKDHCKVFANRPFIWQVWDGTSDGFSALINYHRLDRKLMERLIYDYLGSWWMERQRDDVRREVPGAEVRLAAAEELKAKLELILVGESPYDIFVRWKSLAEQPIGWEPDLDDGVRMNIRPFATAGVLRAKPSINWNKDRGKNPDGSERHNDLHYTLAEKHAARQGSKP